MSGARHMADAGNAERPGPVGIGQVRRWLEEGARVALYIRHAERPPIADDDPTFGAALVLTPAGERSALALGGALRGSVASVRLMASPMERTRRTARLIGDGAGAVGTPVEDATAIGVGNVFTDTDGAHGEMQRVGVMDYMLAYLATGEAAYARPVHEATRLALEWIHQAATAPFTLCCGHDLMIAAALAGLELARFRADNWIPYLTGMALVERGGGWRHYWFV